MLHVEDVGRLCARRQRAPAVPHHRRNGPHADPAERVYVKERPLGEPRCQPAVDPKWEGLAKLTHVGSAVRLACDSGGAEPVGCAGEGLGGEAHCEQGRVDDADLRSEPHAWRRARLELSTARSEPCAVLAVVPHHVLVRLLQARETTMLGEVGQGRRVICAEVMGQTKSAEPFRPQRCDGTDEEGRCHRARREAVRWRKREVGADGHRPTAVPALTLHPARACVHRCDTSQ